MSADARACARLAGPLLLTLVLITATLPADAAQPPAPATLDDRYGIAEGFRNPAVMAQVGAGWERVVLSWADIQPDGPGDFSWLGRTLPPQSLATELQRGERLSAVLQFTPAWAATDQADPGRSVPKNLDLPVDDPNNYWAQFVYHTVSYYRGKIDEFIIWNEPEFQPGDAGAGGSYSWLGTDQQFARLMAVAYQAAKLANPDVTVVFPGTSYWIDQNLGRPQFYERFLALVASDPVAQANHLYHDAVGLNLYRAPDDLVRVYLDFKQIQARYGVDRPLWLMELNAMPTSDPNIPCPGLHATDPIQTSLSQQAAYAGQALSLAAAIGYQRIGFYQMVDDNACTQEAVWGVARDDGSVRRVASALQTLIQATSGFTQATFVPIIRSTQAWSPWPDDPGSYVPNWQVYDVVFDLPEGRRVSVLWNGDGQPVTVRLPRSGTDATLIGDLGQPATLLSDPDGLSVRLPAATAHFSGDPPGYYFIGGAPVLLRESGVPPYQGITQPEVAQG